MCGQVFREPLETVLPAARDLDVPELLLIQAHPAADTPSPTALSLQLGWIPPLVRLSQLTARFQRPVVFTEAGYPSVRGAATQPWRWPNSRDTVDLQLQARAYEALMNACTAMPWCRGVYWWKWYERPENHSHAHDYSPEDKPAEEVIRNWYRVPAPQTPAGPRP